MIPHATLADAARVIDEAGESSWWDGYIRRGEVHLVAAREKTGKTIFLCDLAARCWHGQELPLGDPCPVPAGSSTLWCLGDRQHQQLRDRLSAAGVPLDAVHLAAAPESPLGFWRLDDEEGFESFVHVAAALAGELAFVVVDTAWSAAPGYKLHDTGDTATHFGRLADLAALTRLPILVTNHLNRENGVLGIRSTGIARTIIKLSRVDPSDRTRIRLDVDGNYRPVPPLGLTITDATIDYSREAPEIIEEVVGKPGPQQTERARAKAFLETELTRANDQKAVELVERWVATGGKKTTVFRAKDDLVSEGRLVADESKKPKVWHLVPVAQDSANEPPF